MKYRLLFLTAFSILFFPSTLAFAVDVPDPCPCGPVSGYDGGSSGSSYTPPPPRLPSPAEQAAKINIEAARLMDAHDYENALPKLREALRLNPNNSMILGNLAVTEAELVFKSGNLQAAIERMRAAVNLGRSDVRDELAYFQRQQARLEEEKRAKERDKARCRSDGGLSRSY